MTDGQGLTLNVTDREGRPRRLEAITGWRVMEIIRDYGLADKSLALKAECGGACACATCHVYVEPRFLPLLPGPLPEEIDMLDEAFGVQENSRLSCQLLMTEALDGLAVTLTPGTEP